MNLTSDYDDYFCTHITQFFVMGETNAPPKMINKFK